MGEQFKYDAFISYRHTELDKFVAENLHKKLEAFNLPRSLAKKRKGQKNKIERVFRDKEELPLTNNLEEPIVEALQSSEWLIVICSPRLPESMWCKKEIETFISLRGREHVLAVLIEGEPAESFPEELLFKVEEVKQPDGSTVQVRVPVEPLAADFRGENNKEVLKAMKTEILRVLAAMFQVPFDDLRQRHRERKMRRIMTASLIGGAACLLFGIYSTVTALRIKEQKEQIEAQSVQILEQSQEIQAISEEILKQNEELALRQAKALAELATGYFEKGDRKNAIKTAVEALTESDGIALPYTPEAQYILTESLRVYDLKNIYKADYQYETAGKIDDITSSPDSKIIVLYDDTGTVTLFDLEEKAVVQTFGHEEIPYFGKSSHTFLDNNRFVYIDKDEKVCIYDIEKNSVSEQLNAEYVSRIFADNEGKYLLTEGFGDYYDVYDGVTLQKVGVVQMYNTSGADGNPYVTSQGILANTTYEKTETNEELYTLYFADVLTGQILSTCYMDVKQKEDIKIRDGVAYVLSADYADYYMDCDTYVTAIDLNSGAVLWENKMQGHYPNKIMLPGKETATDLIAITNGSAQLIDMQTGEVTFVVNLNADVLEACSFASSNDFLLLLEDGGMSIISKEYNMCADMSARFECKTLLNAATCYTPYGIVVQERNDNKITIYTSLMGPDVIQLEEVVDFPESNEQLLGGNAFETAHSYGLERPEYVNTLYYSRDNKYCLVHYWDNSLAIYDMEKGEVLNTIEDAYATEWCLGTDVEGFTYLLGYSGCYVLDKNMEPVAWIQNVRNVDLNNRKVYLEDSDICYEAPVYSVEELLKLAEEMNE